MNELVNPMLSDRHEVFTGFRKENQIEAKLTVGAAFKNESEKFYKLKLMMFPGFTYYLVKNKDSADRYTIFSKMIQGREKNMNKFLNPVGSGVLDSNLLSFLELRFPMLKTTLYMSLFSKKD